MKKDTRKTEGIVHLRYVDTNTRALFKAACREREVSMQQALELLMRWYETYEADLVIPPVPNLRWKAALFFRCINPEVYTIFAAQCVRRNKPIYLVVEGLMRQFLKTPDMLGIRAYHREQRSEVREKQRLRKRKKKETQ